MADNPYAQIDPDFAANIQQESGGKQFDKSGKPLTSKAGAVGVAQVMPNTAPEAAEAAGVPYDPYAYMFDSEYNAKIGAGYHQKQVKAFGGDLEKADAAYNAGPGATQKAIKEAEKKGGSWKDYLPEETKKYIPSVGSKRSAEPVNPYLSISPDTKTDTPQTDESNPYLNIGVAPKAEDKSTSFLGSFGAHALEALPSSTAALGGWAAAGAALDVVAPEIGVPIQLAAKFGGMLLAGAGAEKVTESMLPQSAKDYLAKSAKEHPYASLGGEIASYIPSGGIGAPKTLLGGAVMGAAGAGIEAISEKMRGEELDPTKIGIMGATTPFVGAKNIFEKKATVETPNLFGKMTDGKSETSRQYDLFTKKEDENNISFKGAEDIIDPHAGKTNVDVVKDTARDIRADAYLADMWEKEIKTAVPDEGTRKMMTLSIEKDKSYHELLTDEERATKIQNMEAKFAKSEKELAEDKFKTPEDKQAHVDYMERLKYGIEQERAKPSEETAIKILEAGQKRINAIGQEALDRGLIEGLRNNYITHILDWSKSTLNKEQMRSLADTLFSPPKDSALVKDFTQKRIYSTIGELEAALQRWADANKVKSTGIVVKKDYAEIVASYEKAMRTTLAYDKMKTHFLNTGLDGKPGMTRDLEYGIKNKYESFNGVGSKPLEGILVHPELVDPLKFLFRQNDPNMLLRGLGGINFLTKSFNTTMSLFHAWNLGIAGATAAPEKAVKELFTAGAGIRKATEDFAKGVDREITAEWLKTGLMIGTEDVQRSIVADSGEFVDRMLSKMTDKDLKIVQKVTTPFDKYVLQGMNKVTWDYMHTGQKLNLANHFFAKIKARNPNLPDDAIRKEVSSFINNTFGGLDWLEVADQVKNKYARAFALKAAGLQGREWAQVLLFAPDWTVSTLRAVSTALPKELAKPKNWELRKGVEGFFNPKTQGDLARRYVFNTMVSWLILLNGMNMAFSGRPIWTNKDPTRVDLGDGTSIQPAKHSMEAAEWLRDPNKTFGNKLGFWPKALITLTTGKAYPSPTAPMVKDNTTLGRLAHVGESALPFQVGSAISAPPGEKLKRGVMSALGIPIYGQTKGKFTSPEVRRERYLKRIKAQQERIKKRREETSQ